MKIEQLNSIDGNGQAGVRLFIDGKEKLYIGSLLECPEDAILERNLNFVYDIPKLMRQAYEAGKAGDVFDFVSIADDER